MNDRELIELAAKAAGIEIQWESDGSIQNRMNRPTIPYFCQNMSSAIDWNPLTDDGDALRLAVKLWIDVSFPPYREPDPPVVHAGMYWDVSDSLWYRYEELRGADPYAATRRAIVKAAAQIGREMK